MKPRIFHCFRSSFVPKSTDGVIKSLPIDQFPAKDCNTNIFGFPKSDLTLLIEYSNSKTFDIAKFNEFASRIHMLKAEPKNNKSIEELIHDWRPAYIQTIAEEQRAAESYYKIYPEDKTDKTDDVKSDIVVEPSNDSANE